jgi:hypothetical protein
MTQWILYVVLGLFLAGAAALLLRPRAERTTGYTRQAGPAEFFPIHCRFFPQVRQAMSPEDAAYIASRASVSVRRHWEKCRRRAGRLYLSGLREDFARLNRLSRALALRAPRVRAHQEAELLWLNLRFQFLYGVVLFRILLGQPAAEELGHIASLIGGLGSRLEQAALAPQMPAGAVTP